MSEQNRTFVAGIRGTTVNVHNEALGLGVPTQHEGSIESGLGSPAAALLVRAKKQTRAFLAGISTTTLGKAAQPVLIKANGQLGVASAASASSAAKPLSARVRRLVATVKRQQRHIESQGQEIRALRAEN